MKARRLRRVFRTEVPMRFHRPPKISALLLTAAGLFASGTSFAQVIMVAPPPPRVEVAPPGRPGYVWDQGHWRWDHGRYVWAGGYWRPVRAGYGWRAGHWVQRGPHWRWVEGRWAR
jgi:hypothetical protein